MKTVQVQWNNKTEIGNSNYGFVFIARDYLALWMLVFFYTVQRKPISHTNADKFKTKTHLMAFWWISYNSHPKMGKDKQVNLFFFGKRPCTCGIKMASGYLCDRLFCVS